MRKNNNEQYTDNNRSNKSKLPYLIITIICILIFLGCAAWVIKYFVDINKANTGMENIIEEYVEDTTEVEEGIKEEVIEEEEAVDVKAIFNVKDLDIDFDALKEEQNYDIYSWIYMPDTNVNYPILQHPTELDYYLDYNIDGSKGYPGCIYTQLLNNKDYSDNNTVLYGHNMKNGSMFANLHLFEDPEFFDEHPYFYIYTETGVLVYEIFGAYEYSNAHLLLSIPVDNQETFECYLDGIYKIDGLRNNFRTDIELTGDDKIVTLSTCISGKPDKRYLVQGVLIANEDGVIREDRIPENNVDDVENVSEN